MFHCRTSCLADSRQLNHCASQEGGICLNTSCEDDDAAFRRRPGYASQSWDFTSDLGLGLGPRR